MPQGSIVSAALDALGSSGRSRLHIGGVAASELAERFGTPLYAHDAGAIRRRFREVREALGPRVDVLYSLKANPSVAIARVLREEGAGAEVASAGEIHVATAAGVPGSAIQLAGPGKSEEDLRLAIERGAGLINVESAAEHEVLAALARRAGLRPRVAVRVNPPPARSGGRLRMANASSRFGVDADDVPALARAIRSEGAVELVGLHAYTGTQCFDAGAWLDGVQALLRIAGHVESVIGAPLSSLGLGGGFGVACAEGDGRFDLRAAGDGLAALIEADARSDRRYAVELGRYLVAEAGAYLARVRYAKRSGGKEHLVLDGGMHHHAAAAGLGAVIRRPFPIVACDRLDAEAEAAYTVGGPLCTPADELGRDVRLPFVAQGDLLAVLVSGAYGLTFSNVLFLGHATPAEVLVEDGRAEIARDRGDARDALRGQRVPS